MPSRDNLESRVSDAVPEMASSALGLAVGLIPGVGAVLGPVMQQLLTSMLPELRLNRITDTLRRLECRVADCEQLIQANVDRAEVQDLFEEGIWQAG
jgi:hypothetical protein